VSALAVAVALVAGLSCGTHSPSARVPNLFDAQQRVDELTEQGCTIVLTMGDRQSDLSGGFAEKTFKLPNPVYFLP
jgi:putative acid phosphatase of HAD superfamily subfamily IIIB